MSKNLYSTGQKVLSSQGQENWDKINWLIDARPWPNKQPASVARPTRGPLVTMYEGWSPDHDIGQIQGHDVSIENSDQGQGHVPGFPFCVDSHFPEDNPGA